MHSGLLRLQSLEILVVCVMGVWLVIELHLRNKMVEKCFYILSLIDD